MAGDHDVQRFLDLGHAWIERAGELRDDEGNLEVSRGHASNVPQTSAVANWKQHWSHEFVALRAALGFPADRPGRASWVLRRPRQGDESPLGTARAVDRASRREHCFWTPTSWCNPTRHPHRRAAAPTSPGRSTIEIFSNALPLAQPDPRSGRTSGLPRARASVSYLDGLISKESTRLGV